MSDLSTPAPTSRATPLTPPASSASVDAIRDAIARTVATLRADESAGRGTAVTRVRLRPGLACDVQDGPHRFTVGMSARYGGSDAAPNPGVFGRAAVGACLAVGYGMWAARLGVPIDALDVEVQADYDARGEFAVDDGVSPGYLAMRYVVSVESPASEDDVLRLLDTADRYSAWRDDMLRPMPLERVVKFTRTDR